MGTGGRRGGARRGGRLREWLFAQLERAAPQVRDALAERFAQARVDCCRQGREVLFGLGDRRFGGRTAPFATLCCLCDGFEIALQRPGVGSWDQAFAGAPAGNEQGGENAQ